MPALWLAQLLCPQRHCIIALAYDIEGTKAADIEARLLMVVNTPGMLDPWCGICRSLDLHIEHNKLPTDDWDEAMARLRANEAAQIATRLKIEAQKQNRN